MGSRYEVKTEHFGNIQVTHQSDTGFSVIIWEEKDGVKQAVRIPSEILDTIAKKRGLDIVKVGLDTLVSAIERQGDA